jgi:hypothetical protein
MHTHTGTVRYHDAGPTSCTNATSLKNPREDLNVQLLGFTDVTLV